MYRYEDGLPGALERDLPDGNNRANSPDNKFTAEGRLMLRALAEGLPGFVGLVFWMIVAVVCESR